MVPVNVIPFFAKHFFFLKRKQKRPLPPRTKLIPRGNTHSGESAWRQIRWLYRSDVINKVAFFI